jgi:hypothetical protein
MTEGCTRKVYMLEMIKERLAMGKREHSDLFSNLLASSFSDEFGATALSEAELIGARFSAVGFARLRLSRKYLCILTCWP